MSVGPPGDHHKKEETAELSLKLFQSQALGLQIGIQAFTPLLEELHSRSEQGEFPDWPTVLQATLLQTTSVSLFKLLPPAQQSRAAIDLRSIASLIRNLIDTHDSIAMLCRFEHSDEWNLHRDVLGYYLSGRIEKIQSGINPAAVSRFLGHAKGWYLEKIRKSNLTKQEKARIEGGETILYKTRRKRIDEIAGVSGDFISAVLTDLSTYVHSTPPALWFKPLKEGFDDTSKNRAFLAVWLQIANVYFADSVRILLHATGQTANAEMNSYLDRYKEMFRTERT